ncbi:TAP42-like protein [Stereum hirsutum FP-91666 SS1]|uniref:TAP42-like protein n=1 Tax=Stereum hirsutum (strain FP-91666) TaxID=721885 RepID=UPI000440DEE8|nr:TAP42-like protein [Stereum hirsutum FP-91666 SS1]EIM90345.1 TAP42-like protein [Stereum hirsutum FP-91666 SS1]
MATLSSLFHRALLAASKATDLPTIEDATQELVDSALKDLKDVRTRVAELALFSANETLEDISTRNLVYLLVPFTVAELEGRSRASERDVRFKKLLDAERDYRLFLSDLELYEVIPEDERELYARRPSSVADAAKRRETKIKQYKQEKEIRAKIEAIRKRRNLLPPSDSSPTDFDLIASLLPSPLTPDTDEDDKDTDTDDILREATLLLLRLTYAQAHSQLESISLELELLRNAPPESPQEPDDQKSKPENEVDWKLDRPSGRLGAAGGPILDPQGKPLRPFTILPAGAADRARLQSQVFQADHRLPTMTIDDYLEEEQRRGNIITGGGAASAAKPTTSEQLALDSEQDGTAFGRDKEEEQRQKDENWARYTDENPRGAGNTMNRG